MLWATLEEVPDQPGVYEPTVETAIASTHQTTAVVGAPAKKKATTWHLLTEFNSLSQEDKARALPFCIAESVTLKQFHTKCDRLESGGCFRWEFKGGKVWIYELPHEAHESAASEIIWQIRHQMGEHANDVIVAASPQCDNDAANWSYGPDGSLTVFDHRPGPGHPDAADAAGNRWPNIIVEVALRESEPHVLAKALNWLDTATNPNNGVQQVIVIKIGTTVRSDGHRTMKAWRYERGTADNPVQTIEFGNHGHNYGATEAGMDGMQLYIPVASVYLPNDPPADFAGPLVLDLYYIRRTIEASF